MKAYILAAILPCMVLAADEAAPFSFMSVKPVAPVAAEVADKAPEEALKALKDAMSAKAWTQVVERCDALLAIPKTATADRLEWTERKREALERIGRWDDALAASMAELAIPMASNTLHGVRMRIARTLREKLSRQDDALRLALEIMDDEKSLPDWRADAALLATSIAQAKKDNKLATEILLKADALPTSSRKRGEVHYRLVGHSIHVCRPQVGADIRKYTWDGLTNSFLPFGDRFNCGIYCLEWYRGMPTPAEKLAPVQHVRALLAEAGSAILAREAARIEGEILKNQRAAGESARADAFATATALFNNTNALAWVRIAAGSHLAERKRADGDEIGANAILESCYAFPDNTPAHLEDIAKQIGKSFIMRDECEAAIESYKVPLRYNSTPDMKHRVNALILAAYKTFYRHEEARSFALLNGNRIEAANISSSLLDDRPTAKRLYREVLEDQSAPRSDRVAAWRWFFILEPKLVERYLPVVLGSTEASTNEAVKILTDMIAARGGSSYSFSGNFDAVRRAYGMLEGIHKATGKTWSFAVMQYAANAFCAGYDFDAAAKICRDAIEWKVTQEPAELYQLNMMAAIFPLKGDEDSIFKAIRAADEKFAGELPQKTRLSRLHRIGGAAVTGANEPLARALAAYRKSLFVPVQKREYVVHYSEEPIIGLGGWDKIVPKPETQLMNRQYGGSMEFLATDVATGNRGEGIGTEKAAKDAPVPTIEIACDAFGIHFKFEAPDEKADQMAAGFLGGGTYEAYLAPGENQPYYCLLMDVAPNASVGFFNTTYNTTGHRRIRNADHTLYKSETAFTDHSAVSYIMLSWNALATLIPSDKTVWEFENVHWGRADKAAWNGTESIHGRSTWGRLVFDLPEKARIEILKRVIFHVRRGYQAVKSKDGMGAVGRWNDAVLGDPEFYKKCVEPLLADLDAYLPLVKVDMSDEDVLKVAEEALPRWRDIEYEVARLRARYMADKLAE